MLARASAVIGVATRLAGAIDSVPFAAELNLRPLIQGDAKLTEIIAALQPHAQTGVASRTALEEAAFPAVARPRWQNLAGNSRRRLRGQAAHGLVSLRRVGDVPSDTTEAKVAAPSRRCRPATSPRRPSW